MGLIDVYIFDFTYFIQYIKVNWISSM